MATEYDLQPLSKISSFIVGRCGARFEAEPFAAISECPFVIRSFEFAPADGAIFATADTESLTGTLSERFWQLNEEVRRYCHAAEDSERRCIFVLANHLSADFLKKTKIAQSGADFMAAVNYLEIMLQMSIMLKTSKAGKLGESIREFLIRPFRQKHEGLDLLDDTLDGMQQRNTAGGEDK